MKPSFPLEPVGGEGLLPTGKHGGRDSIRSKVFEEDGGGLEGEGETFFRKFQIGKSTRLNSSHRHTSRMPSSA